MSEVGERPKRSGPRIWYRVEVPSAHVGSGKKETHELFVFAKDASGAFDRATKMRGWKRDLESKTRFPDIRELSAEEVKALEKRIQDTEKVTLPQARAFGFYGKRRGE